MLKNCFLPVNYNKPSKTCGEIVYQSFNEVFICCKLCHLKIFIYDEFLNHLKNVHLEILEESFMFDEQQTANVKDSKPINNILDKHHQDEVTDYAHHIKIEQNDDVAEENGMYEREDFDFYDNDDKASLASEYEPLEEEEPELKSIIKKPLRKPKEYVCAICSKKYADEKRLQMHVKIVHLREKSLKCDACDESFTDNRCLQSHIKHKHTGFNCPTCHKKISSHRNLKRHMLIHIEIKKFRCTEEGCGKSFASNHLLKCHQRCHNGEIFICEECGFKCRKRDALIVHKRHHTGEKPFSCELCDKRFGSKPLLKEHMVAHEPDRKHTCEVCGKSFNRPKALYHHKHLHLGIKKFVCKICGQAYAQAAGLSAHMRRHKTESLVITTVDSNMSPPPSTFYPKLPDVFL